jgi:hypothetical protein
MRPMMWYTAVANIDANLFLDDKDKLNGGVFLQPENGNIGLIY